MTVLTIVGSVAAIIVAVITIWNTATVSRVHIKIQAERRARHVRKRQSESIKRFAAEPALAEIADRFDELHDAYTSKDVPYDLRVVWNKVFRLVGKAPVTLPFQYGTLVFHWDMSAMNIRKGSASITGREELDPLRIPPPPHSAIARTLPSMPVIPTNDCPTTLTSVVTSWFGHVPSR